MGLRINQNIMAMNSYRNLTTSESQLSKSLEKLSSGFRINKAADDASGLVISEGLRSQVRGLKMAIKNTQDGVSVVQTAEGALTEVHSLLQRIRELAVQAASTGSSDPAARAAAHAEVAQLVEEVDRIGNTTRFGGQKLLDGSYGIPDAVVVGGQGQNFTPAVAAEINADNTAVALGAIQAHTFATDENFTLVVDGVATNITFVAADDFTGATAADIQSAVQAKIDAAIGGGVVTVTLDDTAPANPIFTLERNSTANGTSVQILEGVGGLANDIFASGAAETSNVDPAIAGTAGSFSTTGGTAVIRGSAVGALTGDYSADPQTFRLTVGDVEYDVTIDADLSAAANPAQALETELNAQLVTATRVSDAAVTDISGLVDADVIYADETGQIQVELRTVATGTNASLAVAAVDGADAGGAVDSVFTALFGAPSSTTLEGEGNSGGVFQVGADAGETIGVAIRDIRSAALGVETAGVVLLADSINQIDIADDASAALAVIDAAITQVSTQRGDLGAIQNRFEHTIANLSVTVENLSASESRIRDTDMAEEMMAFTRAQILQQAGTAMLAQANAVPQSVLQLLQ